VTFAPLLLFFLGGAAVVFAAVFLSRLLAPQNPNPVKNSTYECGEETVGPTWVRFNSRFYIVALIFLVFDVEVLFLYPWALNLRDLGLYAWIDMAIFIVILVVGLAYVWGKGDLEWVRLRGSSAGSAREE